MQHVKATIHFSTAQLWDHLTTTSGRASQVLPPKGHPVTHPLRCLGAFTHEEHVKTFLLKKTIHHNLCQLDFFFRNSNQLFTSSTLSTFHIAWSTFANPHSASACNNPFDVFFSSPFHKMVLWLLHPFQPLQLQMPCHRPTVLFQKPSVLLCFHSELPA